MQGRKIMQNVLLFGIKIQYFSSDGSNSILFSIVGVAGEASETSLDVVTIFEDISTFLFEIL